MPQTKSELAYLGYIEAMHLLSVGKLASVKLWQPAAFDEFREAMVDGAPNHQWMDRFNVGLRDHLGDSFVASFIDAGDEDYPDGLQANEEPLVVVKITREVTRTLIMVIRPQADQAISVVTKYSFRT